MTEYFISAHAIARFQERFELVSNDQAAALLVEIADRGRDARCCDWHLFGILPRSDRSYRVSDDCMIVLDGIRILTVLAVTRSGHERRPEIRALRGQRVNDALAMLHQE